jgi:hypothetical protein
MSDDDRRVRGTHLGDQDSERSSESEDDQEEFKDFLASEDEESGQGGAQGFESGDDNITRPSLEDLQRGTVRVHPRPDSPVGGVSNVSFFNTLVQDGNVAVARGEEGLAQERRLLLGMPSQESLNQGNPFSSFQGQSGAAISAARHPVFMRQDMDFTLSANENANRLRTQGGQGDTHDDEISLSPSLGGLLKGNTTDGTGGTTRAEGLPREPALARRDTRPYGHVSAHPPGRVEGGRDERGLNHPPSKTLDPPNPRGGPPSGGGVSLDYEDFPSGILEAPSEVNPPAPQGSASRLGGGILLDYADFPGVSQDVPVRDHCGDPLKQRDLPGQEPVLTDFDRVCQHIQAAELLLSRSNADRERMVAELGEDAVRMRVEVLKKLETQGSLADLLWMSTESKKTLLIDHVDVVGRSLSLLHHFVDLYAWSYRSASNGEEKFDLSKLLAVVEESQAHLVECRSDFVRVGSLLQAQGKSTCSGQDYFQAVKSRLDSLVAALKKSEGATPLSDLMPVGSAPHIINWYLKLNCMILEVMRGKALYTMAVQSMARHMEADPCPPLMLPPTPPAVATRERGSASVSSLRSSSGDAPMARPMEALHALGFGYRIGGQGREESGGGGGGGPPPGRHQGTTVAYAGVPMNEQGKPAAVAHSTNSFQRQLEAMTPGGTPPWPNRNAVPPFQAATVPQRKKHPVPPAAKVPEEDGVSVLSSDSKAPPSRSTLTPSEAQSYDWTDEIREYARKGLGERNKLNETTLQMVLENIPKHRGFNRHQGAEQKFMRCFSEVRSKLTPDRQKQFVNVSQWLRLLSDQFGNYGLPIPYQIQFMKLHSGLKEGHCALVERQVKNAFKRATIKKWLPGYDANHSENDEEYWVFTWVEIQLKLIADFWLPPNETSTMVDLRAILKKLKFTTNNPLNEEFYLVVDTFDSMITLLEDQSSLKNSSHGYVMTLIREHLRTLIPGGPFVAELLSTAIKQLVTNPQALLPIGHSLSEKELSDLCMRGEEGLRGEDYDLLLDTLKGKANQKSLEYAVTDLDALKGMIRVDWKGPEEKGKAQPKKASMNVTTVTTDADELVLAVSSGGTRSPPCSSCNMFHGKDTNKVPCPYWNKQSGKVNLRAILQAPGVLVRVRRDNSWIVGTWFLDKLRDFGFKAMGIDKEADQQKVVADLKAVAKSIGKHEVLPSPLFPSSSQKTAPSSLKAQVTQLQKALQVKNLKLKEKAGGKETPKVSGSVSLEEHEQVEQVEEEDRYLWDSENEQWIDQED